MQYGRVENRHSGRRKLRHGQEHRILRERKFRRYLTLSNQRRKARALQALVA